MRKLVFLFVAALFILPSVAMAEFRTGSQELTLSGTGSSDNDFDSTTLSLQGSYGYFFTDALEGLIRQDLALTVRDNASDDWNASTAAVLDYNFNLGNFVPFVGAAFGYVYGDNVEETWFAGPEIGLKSFLNQSTFVQVLAQYQWLFDDGNEIDDNFDDGRFLYGLGIGYTW